VNEYVGETFKKHIQQHKIMEKLQLLSPVGSFDALVAAVNNGADAVYLGSKLFNARRLANNFTNDDLKKAVQYAHLRNVKVCLTLNTLIKNNEIIPLLNQVSFAAQLGVDALIMQDLTFAPLIKQHFPQLEIHASTQSTIMNSPSVEYWKKYISTFVLARELTKQEVKEIYHRTNANLEIFIHGHLCSSYSGQCLVSSLIGERSGNRGLCASSCRRPYNNHEYLLSAKDLCMINNIKYIINSGAKTVKIEGRMKSAEYVATTTRIYRQQIDNYYKQHFAHASNEMMNELRMAFNREFTPGYFNNEQSIIDPTYSSIRVIYLCTVHIGVLQLEEYLEIYDGIGIIYYGERSGEYVQKMLKNEREVFSAKRGEQIKIPIPGFVNNAKIYLMSKRHGKNPLGENKKIPISITITIKEQTIPTITISIINQQTKTNTKTNLNLTTPASKPLKYPFTREQIQKELEKYDSNIFSLENINITTDNSFIPKSELTNFRNQLDQIILDQLLPITSEKIKITPPEYPQTTATEKKVHVHVYSLHDIQEAINANANIIYYDAFASDLNQAINLTKNTNSKLYIYTPMALTDTHLDTLKTIIQKTSPQGILANNVGVLHVIKTNFPNLPFIIGYQMNIFNDNQIQYYHPTASIASIELNTQEVSQFQQKDKLIYFAHGYPVVMSFKEQFDTTDLTDGAEYTFHLRKNSLGTTEMLYSKALGILQHTPKIIEAGIIQLYLDLEQDVFKLVTLYKRLLNNEQVSVKEFKSNVTIGNLIKGVM